MSFTWVSLQANASGSSRRGFRPSNPTLFESCPQAFMTVLTCCVVFVPATLSLLAVYCNQDGSRNSHPCLTSCRAAMTADSSVSRSSWCCARRQEPHRTASNAPKTQSASKRAHPTATSSLRTSPMISMKCASDLSFCDIAVCMESIAFVCSSLFHTPFTRS